MPLIYRVMTRDGDKPMVGDTARALGVRLPPSPHADIKVNDDGTVGPGGGGMSVVPDISLLPAHRVPKQYVARVATADGKDEDSCWRMGDGPFVLSDLSSRLMLRPDRPGHGLVEPKYAMLLSDFQAALAATRDAWVIVAP